MICTVAVPGRILLAALNHAVARLPIAAGQFPQVSGLTMRVDAGAPANGRVRDVRVADQPLDLNRTYRLAIPDFVLLGGDGFDMFRDQQVLVGPESGPSMAAALETYFASRREVAPAVEGRITIVP